MANIKVVDEKAWKSVLVKWNHPTEAGSTKLKDEAIWWDAKDKQSSYNSKFVSVIYTYANTENFELIKTCKEAHTMKETKKSENQDFKLSSLSLIQLRWKMMRQSQDIQEDFEILQMNALH